MKAINCKNLFVEETFICQTKAVRDYFIQPLSGRESEAYSAACENIPFHFHYRPRVGQSVVYIFSCKNLKHVSKNLFVNVKLF